MNQLSESTYQKQVRQEEENPSVEAEARITLNSERNQLPQKNEIWKQFRDLMYEVSNLGNVRRMKGSERALIRPFKAKTGYLVFTLSANGRTQKYSAHRMVAEVFIPNPKNKPEVNHKDSNRQNNSTQNLEWVTREENVAHAVRSGRYKSGDNHVSKIRPEIYDSIRGDNHYFRRDPSKVRKGEESNKAVLTADQVIEIRKLHSLGFKRRDLLKKFPVGSTQLRNIINRSQWKHI